MSHPVWVCGLKLLAQLQACIVILSHPVWVCGLKLIEGEAVEEHASSHPVWVCGLKHYSVALGAGTEGHTLYGCVD